MDDERRRQVVELGRVENAVFEAAAVVINELGCHAIVSVSQLDGNTLRTLSKQFAEGEPFDTRAVGKVAEELMATIIEEGNEGLQLVWPQFLVEVEGDNGEAEIAISMAITKALETKGKE